MVLKRNKKLRLKNYNYSQNGYYFVTICTKDKQDIFGYIKDEKLILNRYGLIANKFWEEIPNHFNNIKLDEFLIMPDHIHGIIIIDRPKKFVGDRHACHLLPQYKLLSIVIGSFKSRVTKEINIINKSLNFKWQRSYYDHIIRANESLDNIRNYIKYNFLKENQNDDFVKNF